MRRFLLALALIIMIVQPTAAQDPGTAVSTIKSLFVDETSFGVVTDSFIQNPARCPWTDGYRSQRELYYATALTAFTMTTLVTITIHSSECVDGRPKIVSMTLNSRDTDLAVRMNTMANRLDTIEQRVNDVNNQTNQIAQRADQVLAQGNQIASKVDGVEQTVIGNFREMAHDPDGLTLINLVDLIAQKVGAR